MTLCCNQQGEVVIRASQYHIAEILETVRRSGRMPIRNGNSWLIDYTGQSVSNGQVQVQNVDKPIPLGVPTWNWEQPTTEREPVAVGNCASGGDRPTPLGLPRWDW